MKKHTLGALVLGAFISGGAFAQAQTEITVTVKTSEQTRRFRLPVAPNTKLTIDERVPLTTKLSAGCSGVSLSSTDTGLSTGLLLVAHAQQFEDRILGVIQYQSAIPNGKNDVALNSNCTISFPIAHTKAIGPLQFVLQRSETSKPIATSVAADGKLDYEISVSWN